MHLHLPLTRWIRAIHAGGGSLEFSELKPALKKLQTRSERADADAAAIREKAAAIREKAAAMRVKAEEEGQRETQKSSISGFTPTGR